MSYSSKKPQFLRSISSGIPTESGRSHVLIEEHSLQLLKGINDLRQQGLYYDVILDVNGFEIHGHKIVLASLSKYFGAMFGLDMKESTQERIMINDLNGAVVEKLVDFAYTGEIDLTTENIQDIFECANYLNIESVCIACSDYLMTNINDDNCLGILCTADLYGQLKLRATAYKFALGRFVNVSQSSEFSQLPIAFVEEFLRDEKLLIAKNGVVLSPDKQEQFLLETLLKYVKHDLITRKSELLRILTLLRLPLIDKKFLNEISKTEELLKEPEGEELVQRAHRTKPCLVIDEKLETWIRPRLSNKLGFHHSRPYANGGEVNTVVGKFDDGEKIKSACVSMYISGMKIWIRRWDDRPVVGGMKIFYSDGSVVMHGQEHRHEIEEFTLDENERINKVKLNSGWMIDYLQFHTTSGRVLGPYGGSGGSSYTEQPPSDAFGFLACVRGAIVDNQGSQGITKLKFIWGYYDVDGKVEEQRSAMPRSGKWEGAYQQWGEEYPFTVDIHFTDDGEMIGSDGSDGIGPFTLSGEWDRDEKTVIFVKQYTNAHDVDYDGEIRSDGLYISGHYWGNDTFYMKHVGDFSGIADETNDQNI